MHTIHKAILSLVIVAGALPATLNATSQELKVSGNKVVTVNGGCQVFLKGVNVPSLEWSNTGEGPSSGGILTSVQTVIGTWKANIVRVPLNQDRWMGKSCSVTQSSYQALVDSIVNYCNTQGAWCILDLHWSDTGTWGGGNVCTSGQHDMPDSNSQLFWTDIATRYANNPAVLFDIYNEPKGITDWNIWQKGGAVTSSDGGWTTPGMQAVMNTIRSTGAKNIVVAGGLDWAYNLTGIPTHALSETQTATAGNGVIYATHIYPWKGSGSGCALSCWQTAVPTPVLGSYAVMVTEFGQNNNADGVANNTWSQAVMDFAKAYCVGYTAWCLHTGATPNLISDWSFTRTAWFGTTVYADLTGTTTTFGCIGTPTYTPTRTSTRTPTPSASPTGSPTASRTASPTPSSSPTGTGSASPSPSPSSSPSRTATPTPTPTGTGSTSPSPSASPSGSATPTCSPSPTGTGSASPSPSASPSGSSSPSPSPTPTPTSTGSSTESATPSPTATPTSTNVPPGSTETSTPTISPTHTASGSPTASETPSITASASPSQTATGSATASSTALPSATPSATPNPTSQATASPSATSTAGPTTPSPSETQAPGEPDIIKAYPYPNPNPKCLVVQLKGALDGLNLTVYTTAMTKIGGAPLTGGRQGWNRVRLPGDWLGTLPNGVYYWTLQGRKGGADAGQRLILKVLLER